MTRAPLSNQGGIITLLNTQGLNVHGISYTLLLSPEMCLIIDWGVSKAHMLRIWLSNRATSPNTFGTSSEFMAWYLWQGL
jgi:hypothetical protein